MICVPRAAERLRREGGHAHRELVDRPGDAQAVTRDGVHVLDDGVDHGDVVAGAREIRAQRPADRARAPDETIRMPPSSPATVIDDFASRPSPHEPVSRARVSSTATCHSASISSSER